MDNLRKHLVWAGFALLLQFQAVAGVRISEVVAASSEHTAVRLADGTVRIGAGPAWFEPAFDASAWPVANGPFGFGFADADKNMAVEMQGVTPSLYLRKAFGVSTADAASSGLLKLSLAYTDGFILYINGKEVLRKNMGGTHMPAIAEMPALNKKTSGHTTNQQFTIGPANQFLQAGTNVMAIQLHNDDPADGQLFCRAFLRIDLATPVIFQGYRSTWNYFVGTGEPSGGLISDDPAAGHFTDYIELHNDGASAANLDGWALTDEFDTPGKWLFPAVSIPAGGYLVVRCSELDKRDPALPLHTNFKLGGDGERVLLTMPNGTIATDINPNFRKVGALYSYGWHGADYAYSNLRTPGKVNAGTTFQGVLKKPELQLAPGHYPAAQSVLVTPGDTNVVPVVRYTTDGSEPTAGSPPVFGAIPVSVNTPLRARSFLAGWIPSGTETRTYLIGEPALRQSLHTLCLTGDDEQTIYRPNGVTAVVGGGMTGTNSKGIAWEPYSPDDYSIPLIRGRAFERPVSIELVDPADASRWIQEDGGVRIAGSNFTRPRYELADLTGVWDQHPHQKKPGFNLYFRDSYGAGKLDFPWLSERPRRDTLKRIKLRSGKNDYGNPFLMDELIRRVFHRMDQPSAVGEFAAVYVNGEYKAYYNPTERYTEEFLNDYHNTDSDWDIYNHNGVQEGDAVEFDLLNDFAANNDLTQLANYQQMAELIDMDNWIDYLLLLTYCGTLDWPESNYYLSRERRAGAKWRWHVWDAEASFNRWRQGVDFDPFVDSFSLAAYSRVGLNFSDHHNARLFQALRNSPEFKQRFADRVQKHMYNDGVLTEAAVQTVHDDLERQIAPLITDLLGEPFDDSYVQPWLDQRRGPYLDILEQQGFWTSFQAPLLTKNGGPVAVGFNLFMLNPNSSGTLYYTTDGSDPRLPGGGLSPSAIVYTGGAVTLTDSTLVLARVRNGGTWSPCVEAQFVVPAPKIVRITEIMYHPPDIGLVDEEDFEFIELQNVGNQSIDLSNFRFADGIGYTFPQGSMMDPGERWVLAGDAAGFAAKYPGVTVYGIYDGKLKNGGEKLTIVDLTETDWLVARYDDEAPWPTLPDGGDYSLSLVNPSAAGVFTNAADWFVSCDLGGTPGAPPGAPAQALAITQQPADVQVDEGASASFSITVSGCPAPTHYEWWMNGQPVTETNSTFTVGPLSSAENLSQIHVLAVGLQGSILSRTAELRVDRVPTLIDAPTFRQTSAISFNAVIGQVYEVQACDHLPGGTWTTLATITADTAVEQFTDPAAAGVAHRVYRIRRL